MVCSLCNKFGYNDLNCLGVKQVWMPKQRIVQDQPVQTLEDVEQARVESVAANASSEAVEQISISVESEQQDDLRI